MKQAETAREWRSHVRECNSAGVEVAGQRRSVEVVETAREWRRPHLLRLQHADEGRRTASAGVEVALLRMQQCRDRGVERWRGETGGDSAGVEVACDERVQQCGGGGRKSA